MLSLENRYPSLKNTNRIKKSNVCCMNNFTTNQWWKLQLSEIFRQPVLLLGHILSSEAILAVSCHSHCICHLDYNVMLFFWFSPSEFKSSFNLRKGHFPTIQGSEDLPSPTEKPQSRQVATACWNFRANWKFIGKLPLVDLFIITNLKMHNPEKGGLSVHRWNFLK